MTRSEWVVRHLAILLAKRPGNIRAPSDYGSALQALLAYVSRLQKGKT
jgi:hypothetical protein